MPENNLKNYIDDFFDNLILYDDYKNGHYYKDLLMATIHAFLENENEYNAYQIYETFFMIYQITSEDKSEASKVDSPVLDEPNTLLNLVEIMRMYEERTGDLIEKQRDHFIHSVNVFLLGLSIYSQNKHYREKFREYVIQTPYKKYYRLWDDSFSHEEFLYRWGIASLFHDIGYPIEIIGKQMKKFLNDSIKSISYSYDVDTAIDFNDFNEFNSIRRINPDFADDYRNSYSETKFLDLFKPTDIMAHKISIDFPKSDVNQIRKHLDGFVDVMGENGFIDHGYFSSILVLNSYGYLIQKHSKNHDFFFYPIVDSATAILLHNYYGNVLRKKPFEFKELHPVRNPLAFLLILCDELQEWNRQPYGTKDKKKSRVAELNITITDDVLSLEYIIKSGAMGLGFSKNKEDFLNNVLSLRGIFRWGLSIKTEVNHSKVIKDMEREETHSSNVLLRNVEKLAVEVHNDYVANLLKDGKTPDTVDFHDLSPELKMSNIRQAKSIATKLAMVGCEMAPYNDEREEYELTRDEIIDLAIYEHEQWCKQKFMNGWTYGSVKDEDNKIHPCLVEWVDERYMSEEEYKRTEPKLPSEEQEKDIDAIENIPNLLHSIGMKVVMSKLKLLTIEKHKFYQSSVGGADFKELPYDVQYSNFKQTDVLVRILGELGLNIVSVDDSSKAINSLTEDQIEYLAKRDHRKWCDYRFDLGWEYGPIKDHELKTNPNLVHWDDLDDEIKLLNLTTFENLPKLCENVGLKIVKD